MPVRVENLLAHIMLRHITSLLLLAPTLCFATDLSVTVYNKDLNAKTCYHVSTVRSFYSDTITINNVKSGENASTTWNVVDGNDASIRLSVFDDKNNAIARVVFVAAAIGEPVLARTAMIENYYPDNYIITADPAPHPGFKDTQKLGISIERKRQLS